jgi:hypothetical protein
MSKIRGFALYEPDDIDLLLSDLDNLLTNLDVGWQPLGRGGDKYQVGEGGCLFTAMNRSLTAACIPYTMSRDRRLYNMMGALGFTMGPGNKYDVPANAVDTGAMYHWNDAQTDVDCVKNRVKDAINHL